jgi:hypothetical protein
VSRPLAACGALVGGAAEVRQDRADPVALEAGVLALVIGGKLAGEPLLVVLLGVDVAEHVAEAVGTAASRPALPGVVGVLRHGERGGQVDELLEIVGGDGRAVGVLLAHRSALCEARCRAAAEVGGDDLSAAAPARTDSGVRGMVSQPFLGVQALPITTGDRRKTCRRAGPPEAAPGVGGIGLGAYGWVGDGDPDGPGETLGRDVGLGVGFGVGRGVGLGVGCGVGFGVGRGVGLGVGRGVGLGVGFDVGRGVGLGVGLGVGFGVGRGVGFGVGAEVGEGVAVGPGEGVELGCAVGDGVGFGVRDGIGVPDGGGGDGSCVGVGVGVAAGKGLKPPAFGPVPVGGGPVTGGVRTWSGAELAAPTEEATVDCVAPFDDPEPEPWVSVVASAGAVGDGGGSAASIGNRPGSPGVALGPTATSGEVVKGTDE